MFPCSKFPRNLMNGPFQRIYYFLQNESPASCGDFFYRKTEMWGEKWNRSKSGEMTSKSADLRKVVLFPTGGMEWCSFEAAGNCSLTLVRERPILSKSATGGRTGGRNEPTVSFVSCVKAILMVITIIVFGNDQKTIITIKVIIFPPLWDRVLDTDWKAKPQEENWSKHLHLQCFWGPGVHCLHCVLL